MKEPVEFILFTECHWYSGFARNAGAYRIATELRIHGLKVQVVDFFGFMTRDDIQKIAKKYVNSNTLAIGFSSTFLNKSLDSAYLENENDLFKFITERNEKFLNAGDANHIGQHFPFSENIIADLVSIFKKQNPKLKIIYGGAKAQNLSAPFVDCFIVDFGEKAILDYLLHLKKMHQQHLPIPSATEHICYDKNDQNFNFSNSKIIWDQCDYIFPDEMLPIEISRGCVFKCKFCSYLLTGKQNLDHVKDMNSLREEMLRNYDLYGTTRYIFCDDTFNDSTEKLVQLAKMTERLPFELSVAAYIRPELTLTNPEQLDLLRAIGLRFAKMGIESLHTETRKTIGKGLPFEKILECLENQRTSWGNEVITSGSFVFGLPYETRESLETLSKWLEHKSLDVLHCISILPLYINFSDVPTAKKSEISINFSDYGYQHLEGNNWYNPHFDYSFKELKEIVSILYKKIQADPRFRHGGFSGMMIQNSGISFDEIANVPFSNLDYNQAQKNYANQIHQYKQNLLGKKKGPARGPLSFIKNFF